MVLRNGIGGRVVIMFILLLIVVVLFMKCMKVFGFRCLVIVIKKLVLCFGCVCSV